MADGSVDQKKVSEVLSEIASNITGEVRSDALTRSLYSTDASIYEIIPDGVVIPKTVGDVAAAVRICARHKIPITPRGGATGLTGGAVNHGIQLDCFRYLNRILEVNPEARTARVEPGVVLDELNAELAKHGLQYAPDVATSSRANLGGVIANNSCGAHSIIYGRACDHIASLEVVLADGSTCTWGEGVKPTDNPLARRCEETLAKIAEDYHDEIEARWPKVARKNAGYALDRLQCNGRVNVESIISGSEGTLAIITGATVKLTPLPKCKGLVVAHFDDLFSSLSATPLAMKHKPAAVELVDRLITDATKGNSAMVRRRWFIEGDPETMLVCELYDEDEASLKQRLTALVDDFKANSFGYAHPVITDPAKQADVWEVRKAGVGLLMSKPGERQPYAFIEDGAVGPDNLHDYIVRLDKLLREEGINQIGYYAHASVGCLHVRPALNLRQRHDIELLERIADKVSSLVLEFGGSMTGEHGDGIVRSGWLEKAYGSKIIEAFKKVKSVFDPDDILNPGKIITPLPMQDNLRYGEDFKPAEVQTFLDFSAYGGLAGLAGMCSGVGQCRQKLAGTMCPSFMATNEEKHSTRARANAMRIALSNKGLIDGLADPALTEVFDLCLACKACKTECPTGADVTKLKTEWLAHKNRREGVPRRSRLIGASVAMAPMGCFFAPLSNMVMQNRLVRFFMEKVYGLDRRVPPPKFVRQTFRKWLKKQKKVNWQDVASDKPNVVYFVDSWTNFYEPSVGQAAVKVLEALGFNVVITGNACSGRPQISKGLLPEAKLLCEHNVDALAPYAEKGIPIVGTEPSCVSVLIDELPQLVPTTRGKIVADAARTIDTFVAEILENKPDALKLNAGKIGKLLYHGHCHEKSLIGTESAMRLLNACTGGKASEINSGCCGMAGAFGHEVEHYDVAKAVGEQRLFPVIRQRGDASVAVSGFSCRHQVHHHTGVRAKHVIEYVAEAIL